MTLTLRNLSACNTLVGSRQFAMPPAVTSRPAWTPDEWLTADAAEHGESVRCCLLGALTIPPKFQGDQPSKQGRRKQLTDDSLYIGKRADNRMKRRDIAKSGRCQRDKAEIDDCAVGLPMWATWDIGERVRNEMPDQPVQGGKH